MMYGFSVALGKQEKKAKIACHIAFKRQELLTINTYGYFKRPTHVPQP